MFFVLLISFFGVLSDYANSHSIPRRYREMGPIFFDVQDMWAPEQPKKFYPQNNNRIDRPKHAQINQPIHQQRKHNHEPRPNNRRNQ
jgi:hypothetical protein